MAGTVARGGGGGYRRVRGCRAGEGRWREGGRRASARRKQGSRNGAKAQCARGGASRTARGTLRPRRALRLCGRHLFQTRTGTSRLGGSLALPGRSSKLPVEPHERLQREEL